MPFFFFAKREGGVVPDGLEETTESMIASNPGRDEIHTSQQNEHDFVSPLHPDHSSMS
jgi:hypothetical protein